MWSWFLRRVLVPGIAAIHLGGCDERVPVAVDDGTSIEDELLLRVPGDDDSFVESLSFTLVDVHGNHDEIREPLVAVDPDDPSRWKLLPDAKARLSTFLRDRFTGVERDMPDRLLLLLLRAGNVFKSKIEVVSGVRTKKHVEKSKHPLGRAIDFRLRGVDAERLWRFCLDQQRTGCGLYRYGGRKPDFVHMDVRGGPGCWTWTDTDVAMPECPNDRRARSDG